MRKIITIFILFSIVFSMHSYLEAKKKKKYLRVVCLVGVERAPSVLEAKTFDKPNYYSDELITVAWAPAGSGLHFELQNNSESSMSIIWDEAIFVDQANQSHNVTHVGVKHVDKAKSMPPSIIPPGITKSDVVYPSDYISYKSGYLGGWKEKPIFDKKIRSFPTYDVKTKTTIIPFTTETLKAFLVLNVGNEKYQYGFTFKTAMIEKDKEIASLNLFAASKLTKSTAPPAINTQKTQFEIKEGMTVAEIEAMLGKPLSSAKFGNKLKYRYKDWKITFVDGKVSEVDF